MTRKKTTSSRKTTRKSPSRGSTRSKRSRTSRKAPSLPRISLSPGQKMLIVGIVVIFGTAVLALSLIAPEQGQFTQWLSDLAWQLFGWGAIFVPLITGGIGLFAILWGMEQSPKLPAYRVTGVALLFLVFEGFASMVVLMSRDDLTDYWQVAGEQIGGGYLGGLIATTLTTLVGDMGAILTLAVIGLIGAVLVSGITRADVGSMIRGWREREAYEDYYDPELAGSKRQKRRIRINPGRGGSRVVGAPVQLPLINEETPEPSDPQQEQQKRRRGRKRQSEQPSPAPAASSGTATPVYLGSQALQQSWTLPAMSEMLASGADQDTNDAAIREQVEIIEHTLESFGAPATVVEINQGPTVTQFGVEPSYLQMRNGRRTKVKVSKIAGLADDLALALAARSVRIQAPVPGKGYIGIEVPNPAKALVSLRDVIESTAFTRLNSPLALGLGQNVSGQAIVADLAKMPHLLVAGTTGSGKSVLVNSIIACLLLQNTPEELKLVMVDPKRVELTGYNGVPHLAAPVVVDMDRVISTLQWALREMDTRYKMFAQVGARNIVDYNKKIAPKPDINHMPHVVIIIDELADLMMLAPEDTERSVTRLAQMARATGIHMIIATQRPSVDVVTGIIKANFPARIAFAVASSTDSRVILDSTGAERLLGQGDMLFQSPDAPAPLRLQGCFVSDSELNKLILYWQRARRFNLISAESAVEPRPDSARIAPPPAASASVAASAPPETAVAAPRQDATPAQNPPEDKPSARAPQQPTPKPETQKSQQKTRSRTKTKKETEPIAQQPLWEALQEEAEKPEYADELMPEAIALVRKLNKASTSLLQRRFRIGYTRAARMIDAMEEMNIIGPPTGTSKAREVLLANADEIEQENKQLDNETT